MTNDTDSDWEVWGKKDPYFGVCTQDSYRLGQMTDESRAEFFQAGEQRIHQILDHCRRHIDPEFNPKRALDFGCGVGRLLIPVAQVAEHATGLDVSVSMLEEARKNCEERSLNNVTLLKSDDELSLLKGDFDFVYSHIVLQHIPVDRGTSIIKQLVHHVAPGGIGYLQVTYGREDCPETLGVPPVAEPEGLGQRLGDGSRQLVRPAKRLLKKMIGRDSSPEIHEPPMQMNPYQLNQLMFILQSSGVTDVHITFTNHSGVYGVAMYFRKP